MFEKKISKIRKINTKRIFVILCLLCFIGLFVFSFIKPKTFNDFTPIDKAEATFDFRGLSAAWEMLFGSGAKGAVASMTPLTEDQAGELLNSMGVNDTNSNNQGLIATMIKQSVADLLYEPAEENLQECYSDDEMRKLTNLLDLGDSEHYGSAWGVINTVFSFMRPIGFALITTFFLIHLFDLASKDQMTFDMLVKLGVQLIIVVAIAANLDIIVNKLVDIGQGIFSSLNRNTFIAGFNNEEIKTMVKGWKDLWIQGDESAVSPVGAIIKTFLLRFCVLIGEIACAFAAISRMLDVGWRIAFAPIGVANSFEGGANSGGVRYLKGLFAAIIAGAVMWVIFQIGFSISASFLAQSGDSQNGFFNFFMSAGAIFATAGASFSASQRAKEIIT